MSTQTTGQAVAALEAQLSEARKAHEQQQRLEWLKRLAELRSQVETEEENLARMTAEMEQADGLWAVAQSEVFALCQAIVRLSSTLPRFAAECPTPQSRRIEAEIAELEKRRQDAMKKRDGIMNRDRGRVIAQGNLVDHLKFQARNVEGLLSGDIKNADRLRAAGVLR
jgi:hypothetical protein